MNTVEAKLTYEELERQVRALSRESLKLKQTEKAVHRQNEYLTALHEISLGLIDRLDRKELLEAIIERAASLTGTENGYIYLHEPGDQHMTMRVGIGLFSDQLGRRVDYGEGLGGKVWESERPVLVEDYRIWPGRLTDNVLDVLHSAVGIPLKSDHEVLGVIGLAHVDAKKGFEREDIRVLERFAAQAIIALEKARLYSEVRKELSERKRAEAKIRESEQRYRSFLESSPDPVIVYNIKGMALYVNPAFEQTFGFSRDELLGKRTEFVPEESWPETNDAIERMLKGEKIQLFETKRLTRDGRVLDVQLSSTLFFDSSGKPTGNIVTLRDISARKGAEEELKKYREHLEELVDARTAELAKANRRLEQEVDERKRAEMTLRKREKDLEAQSLHLEEVNTALRVLLKQREKDKQELGENVLSNVKELVAPYLEKLKKGRLNTDQTTLIRILDSNLSNIISPFIGNLSSRFVSLTPTEIRVANLVKEGKSNKEIAELLLLSKNTVLFHRHNIRSKLGLKNKKINLRSHLLSFDK